MKTHVEIWDRVLRERSIEKHGIHGPRHWARVERNGLYLSQSSGADVDVVSMFALFHDSCRMNDGFDPGHGERGGAYARQLRFLLDFLDDTAFETLVYACTWHTDQTHHDNPTVQTCFDADRLDLERVGIVPDPNYLNTKAAKELAVGKQLQLLDSLPVRDFFNTT